MASIVINPSTHGYRFLEDLAARLPRCHVLGLTVGKRRIVSLF